MKYLIILLVVIVGVYPGSVLEAVTIDLDLSSLPSTQGSAGPDWVFEGSGGETESQIFSVGLNANNESTLFQDSLGTTSGQRYSLSDTLNPNEENFTLDIRAAVRDEAFGSNHFGFSFFIALGGVNLNVGIGENVVQVNEQTGFRDLISGLNNTDYHDYRLIGSIGIGGSWDLLRDSISIGSGEFQAAPLSNPPNQLHLGDGSGGGNARAEITKYSFSQSAVPEPSIAMILAGFGGLMMFKRKHREV